MAWLNVHFYSQILGLTCTMDVILPEPDQGIGVGEAVWDGEEPLPVLYLLHGLSDDHTIWMRRTSLDRYMAGRKMAIVMPAVHRSNYSNQKFGYDYLKFVAEEVPRVCQRFFKISKKREDNFVAGLSMGGYGAMKVGLNYPDRFCAVASMSGVLDFAGLSKARHYDIVNDDEKMEKLHKTDPEVYRRTRDFMLSFGTLEDFKGSENDVIFMLEKAASEGVIPKMHISIGTEDFLYKTNETFRKKLDSCRIPYEYFELSGVPY